MNDKKVLVGMSGGIDSTATCMMLQERGYEVVGVTMRTWDSPSKFSSPDQELPDYILEAQSLAERLGIEHHVADVREEFRKVIVQNFIDEYMSGRTPNPCAMCNPLFKFRMLTDWADRLDCRYIATGHYSRLEEVDGHVYIVAGDDPRKDQSYFLWRVDEQVFRRCIFPLGTYTKVSVREYLREKGLVAKSESAESMEVCFVDGDYRDFLRQQVPDLDERIGTGKFVDAAGVTLGTHKGFAYYTIGQRKGLGIGGRKESLFILATDTVQNVIYVGEGDSHPGLWRQALHIAPREIHWVNPARTMPAGHSARFSVRIRYRQPLQEATLFVRDQGGYILFDAPQRGITPGQFAAWYDGDELVGSGVISE